MITRPELQGRRHPYFQGSFRGHIATVSGAANSIGAKKLSCHYLLPICRSPKNKRLCHNMQITIYYALLDAQVNF